MEIKKLAAPVGVVAIMIGIAPARWSRRRRPTTSSRSVRRETLNDCVTGAPMIRYTVDGLYPSSDAVPHTGQLYEAAVTVEGLGVGLCP